MTSIVARKGDITRTDSPVIVNAGNTNLWLGSGVAGAIRQRGGASIQFELDRIKSLRQPRRLVTETFSRGLGLPLGTREHKFPCDLGEVVVTHAGDMNAVFVFHAAVMDSQGPYKASTNSEIIYEATKNCLLTARQYGVTGMALPVFGTGVGNMAPAIALGAMLDAINRYPISDFRVTIFGYDTPMFELIREVIK